jgi:ABC-type Fe3+-hydroxamate transport system substrate-binding protein
MIEVSDAIDRQLVLPRPAERIVSLVPSETLSVAELVGAQRLVGRTDYCIEPADAVDSIPSVGGTKGFDVAAITALRPDLVLANKEENSRPQVQALIAAGLPVHVSFPCTVDASNDYLETLSRLVGVDPDAAAPLLACRRAVEHARALSASERLPVFVPIWKDPWMTFDEGAYASDILALCGADNVFMGRARRYPLAADLGSAEPHGEERVRERDTRYPRIRLRELVERGARAVLLPDEPYCFGEADAAAFHALGAPARLSVELVDGKDLFWYGTHVAVAVERLGRVVARVRAECFGLRPNN